MARSPRRRRRPARLKWFWPGWMGFIVVFVWGVSGLPAFGHYLGPYGDAVNAGVVRLRHITDAVTAVNFDYRGIDTLGEEFILFISTIGVMVVLRRQRAEEKPQAGDQGLARRAPPNSDAVRVLGLGLLGPLLVFGIYIVVHGQLTPGGGFQGGVLLASGFWLVYLAGGPELAKAVRSWGGITAAKAGGAAAYALIGLSALAVGRAFLANWLPLGEVGSVFSGGTVALLDLAVGCEVAGAFSMLVDAFMEETLMAAERKGGDKK